MLPLRIPATIAAISLVSFLYTLSFTTQAYAQATMRNSDYIIKMGNFNSIAGAASGGDYNLTFTSGETAVGLYSGSNYKVRAGFQYIYSIIPFRFSITTNEINFGTLTAGEPITRTSSLTISNGSAYGYQVTAIEDHPLRVFASGMDIPDTTCDDGSCTQTTSAAWASLLTYGFGYRCDNVTGTDCATGFTTSTFYKQFANLEASESPVAVMTGTNVGRNKQVVITYKVNVSGSQAAGTYRNIIRYVATPTF